MTGPVGERRNREVALVTDDFRLYHRLAPFFDGMDITVLGLAPGEDVPATVQVLLDGPTDDARSVRVLPSLEATLLSVLQRLDARRHVREAGAYHRVVFGVDPGQVIGLAVLCDEEPLLTAECLSPAETAERIAAWGTGLAAAAWELHVGDGSREVGQAILAATARIGLPLARSIVPEEATNPYSPATGSRHADAAVLIARRRPDG